ncbi:hypothetical protein [Methylorubrum extorquens]|nr:hypothetical protein [Methylorubrum extorquens]WIU38685.1 hypothetical protein KQ926_19110 [Methylorubrum extorquens]
MPRLDCQDDDGLPASFPTSRARTGGIERDIAAAVRRKQFQLRNGGLKKD